MKCQHPFPVPNAIGNTNLWRFFMPCWGHPKLYENGWEIPCFFACGRRKRSRPYSFPHGRPDGDTGAQNHRNEHFSKPKEGGIQHGGMVDASEMQKERERLEVRNRQIDDMFLSLYTDKAKGVISEQRFMKLTAAMEQEQEENQCRLQELMRMLQQSDAQESEVRTFIREIRQYATIQELDEAVLNRLISRILVGEVEKVDGQKVQEVRIVYNFVGMI